MLLFFAVLFVVSASLLVALALLNPIGVIDEDSQ